LDEPDSPVLNIGLILESPPGFTFMRYSSTNKEDYLKNLEVVTKKVNTLQEKIQDLVDANVTHTIETITQSLLCELPPKVSF
jgi:hypothetical protein